MIVVVGHGRSPEGKGWGPRIDSARWVVRMWNWHWQTPADHGSNYDWGLLETTQKSMREFHEHNQHTPRLGWVVSMVDSYIGYQRDLPPRCWLITQYEWLLSDLGKAIGGEGITGRWALTRGGIAACWAVDSAYPGEQVVLVGFDNIRARMFLPTNEVFGPAYQKARGGAWIYPAYNPGGTKDGNHDVDAEARLLQGKAEQRGDIELVFAQDAWL